VYLGAALLEHDYAAHLDALKAVSSELEHRLVGALSTFPHDHIDRITFRVKSVRSFVEKAASTTPSGPLYANPLKEIEDQIGGRVVVFFDHDIPMVIERVLRAFNVVEEKHKRPASPKEFGYEGEHLICIIPADVRGREWETESVLPEVFEIQVRTVFQHAWAAPEHELGYKPDTSRTPEQQRLLAWIAASAWGADRQFETLWREASEADSTPPNPE
jgi:ppGpp synthetase/RelA/SpoT-type nucleotidyltranferase